MDKAFHPSWPGEAQIICDRAIERHGGWAAWRAFPSVRLQPLHLEGLVPRLKGYSSTFRLPEFFEVFPRQRKTVFHGFPLPGRQAIFNRGDLEIPLPGGQNFTLKNARGAYHGWHKLAKWQDRDALYFFGYAWTVYLGVPFILPELEFVSHSTHKTKTESWNALTVQYPDGFDSHCPRESFYFDSTGLLRRQDYYAQIISRLAMGAHYSFEYETVHGIEVALKRRVFTRLGGVALPIMALSADLQLV